MKEKLERLVVRLDDTTRLDNRQDQITYWNESLYDLREIALKNNDNTLYTIWDSGRCANEDMVILALELYIKTL